MGCLIIGLGLVVTFGIIGIMSAISGELSFWPGAIIGGLLVGVLMVTLQQKQMTDQAQLSPQDVNADIETSRLYVGNVLPYMTETTLWELFTGVGTVLSVKQISDHNMPEAIGRAFCVEMQSSSEASKAIRLLHMGGPNLIVKKFIADDAIKPTVPKKPTYPSQTLQSPSCRYFCYIGERVTGPFEIEALNVLHASSVITDDTPCCIEGTETWQSFKEMTS